MKLIKNLINKRRIPKLSNYEPDKTICLIVPHSDGKKGAYSQTLQSFEYSYMKDFYRDYLIPSIESKGFKAYMFTRDRIGIIGAYSEALKKKPCCVMEWHFNSFNGKAKGFEILYKKDNARELLFARRVAQQLSDSLGTRDRGVKDKLKGERGFVNVSQVSKIPSLLIEPFFGDNEEDALNFHKKRQVVADFVADEMEKSFISNAY